MTQLTTIITIVNGRIESVRVHQGLKDEDLVLDYLSHLHDVPEGLCVEMWPIDLYSDLGDCTEGHPVWRHRRTAGAWVRY